MNTLDYKKQFVENLKETGEYWLGFQNEGKERVLNGTLFSICTLIDGVSGLNDFHSLYFIDGLAAEELNYGVELHDMLNTTGENVLVDDLKAIRDYWKASPDLSIKEALDGMVAQFCLYFAGESELNSHTVLEVVEFLDEDNFVEWDCRDLHEIYTELQDITKLNKGDLN